MSQEPTLLAVAGVTLKHGVDTILRDIDFSIDRKEIVTIVGPNGSGKSTLLRIIIGSIKPTTGSVTRTHGLRIGYVPQRLGIEPTMPMTVSRFLALASPGPLTRDTDWLHHVGIADLLQHQMNHLSGGQIQRVLLAHALLTDPDILILDEATQGLDQPGEAAFYRLIEELRNTRGCAVLIVSHDLHVVMSASDRVICLNGHICCQGAPTLVSAAPEYRALFGPGTEGALALYRHEHDHAHDHGGEQSAANSADGNKHTASGKSTNRHAG